MLKHKADIDGVFRALGDSARRAILERLSRGEAAMSDIAAPLSIGLSAVHQHIAVLEDAGLVICEKRGRSRWCRLDATGFDCAEIWIKDRRRLWERRLEALAQHLGAEKPLPKQPRPRRRKRGSS